MNKIPTSFMDLVKVKVFAICEAIEHEWEPNYDLIYA